MAVVKVFKERDTGKYKENTFKSELAHLDYLMNNYLVKEEKVLSRIKSGIKCNDNPKIAYEEFIATKQQFDKYNPEDLKSREFKHYTIAFSENESKKLGAVRINEICKEIIESIPEFNNYQVSIVTHEDKKHVHSHIVVNSVNMINGKKIQLPKEFLTKFQAIANKYTEEIGLSTHKLPHTIKYNDKNTSFNYVDYNAHLKGTISKTEQFARRVESIIKDTKNKYDLYKAIKDNNMFMKWNDKDYKDSLNMGKITIIDNETNEKHRLEKLVRTYNIDVSSNKDLVEHFIKLDKINKLRNEYIIKGIKVNKTDLIKVNNRQELEKVYKEIKQIFKKNKIQKTSYYKLDKELKFKLETFATNIYNNSEDIKKIVDNRTQELLIKARDENKELNYDKEKSIIENKLKLIMSNKIMKIIAYSKGETIHLDSLLKSISRCLRETDRNSIDRANILLRQYEKEKQKAITEAITY